VEPGTLIPNFGEPRRTKYLYPVVEKSEEENFNTQFWYSQEKIPNPSVAEKT
jgi:hypothetical protein